MTIWPASDLSFATFERQCGQGTSDMSHLEKKSPLLPRQFVNYVIDPVGRPKSTLKVGVARDEVSCRCWPKQPSGRRGSRSIPRWDQRAPRSDSSPGGFPLARL